MAISKTLKSKQTSNSKTKKGIKNPKTTDTKNNQQCFSHKIRTLDLSMSSLGHKLSATQIYRYKIRLSLNRICLTMTESECYHVNMSVLHSFFFCFLFFNHFSLKFMYANRISPDGRKEPALFGRIAGPPLPP